MNGGTGILIFVVFVVAAIGGVSLLDRWHKKHAWREAHRWALAQMELKYGREFGVAPPPASGTAQAPARVNALPPAHHSLPGSP